MAKNSTTPHVYVPGSLPGTNEPTIYVIHENEAWVEPLREAFEKQGLPYAEIFAHEGRVDISSVPPEGIFYNRMSASSHTRDHRYAVELTGPFIAWLEAHGRKVINNRRALQLEVRKFEQYLALNAYGIRTPKTIAANSKDELLAAARELDLQPFIVKPNRGGKGQGVTLFNNIPELEEWLGNNDSLDSLDGVLLVQEYVKPIDGHIVRTEFIGGRFHYAVKVDASNGFELCPADVCQAGDAFCPAGAEVKEVSTKPKFQIIANYENPDLEKYQQFLAANGIEIGALEYAQNAAGERVVYDVNINTNYNSGAEQLFSGAGGMERIATFLGEELRKQYKQVKKVA